jgi:hypothetical protein
VEAVVVGDGAGVIASTLVRALPSWSSATTQAPDTHIMDEPQSEWRRHLLEQAASPRRERAASAIAVTPRFFMWVRG